MQRIIIVVTALVLIAGLYLFVQPTDTAEPLATQEPIAELPITDAVREEAQELIQTLTEQSSQSSIDVRSAENFVRADQLLTLPALEPETIALTPLDASSVQEEPDQSASEQNTSEPGSGSTSNSQTNEGSQPGSAVLVDGSLARSGTVSITQGIAPILSFEVQANGQVTAREVTDGPSDTSTPSARPSQQIRLSELLAESALDQDGVFYIHAVSPTDEQGIWGILQHGLIQTFAEGIKLDQASRTLRVEIPEMADETLENRRSSFFGNFLYTKVQDTFVFNYQQGILGQDPNLIQPGQQLVIVSYSEEELIQIYNHFINGGA